MPTYTCAKAPVQSASSTETDAQARGGQTHADDSDYESDGGSHYVPKSLLGSGASARARRFESSTGQAVVVIDPLSRAALSESEINRKHRFFYIQYPEQPRQYFAIKNGMEDRQLQSYRLIVPLIPGVTYKRYIQSFGRIKHIEQQIRFFLSLIEELQRLHARGLVYVDFKGDNVLYDAATGQSHLIDGGLSNSFHPSNVNPCVLSRIFSLNNDSAIAEAKNNFPHVAPECWTKKSVPLAVAHPHMDVYSLGYFLKHKLFEKDLDVELQTLIASCIVQDASKRPSLEKLSEELNALLRKRQYQGYVVYAQMIASERSDPLYGLLYWVADSFLLNGVIRSDDRQQKDELNEYSLQSLPQTTQSLFLELAGLVLLSYARDDKLRVLELPSNYKAALEAEILTIRYKSCVSVAIVEDGTEKTVDVFDKKSWIINQSACESALLALSKSCPELESVTLDLTKPVASALDLWKALTKEQHRSYPLSCVIC